MGSQRGSPGAGGVAAHQGHHRQQVSAPSAHPTLPAQGGTPPRHSSAPPPPMLPRLWPCTACHISRGPCTGCHMRRGPSWHPSTLGFGHGPRPSATLGDLWATALLLKAWGCSCGGPLAALPLPLLGLSRPLGSSVGCQSLQPHGKGVLQGRAERHRRPVPAPRPSGHHRRGEVGGPHPWLWGRRASPRLLWREGPSRKDLAGGT